MIEGAPPTLHMLESSTGDAKLIEDAELAEGRLGWVLAGEEAGVFG